MQNLVYECDLVHLYSKIQKANACIYNESWINCHPSLFIHFCSLSNKKNIYILAVRRLYCRSIQGSIWSYSFDYFQFLCPTDQEKELSRIWSIILPLWLIIAQLSPRRDPASLKEPLVRSFLERKNKWTQMKQWKWTAIHEVLNEWWLNKTNLVGPFQSSFRSGFGCENAKTRGTVGRIL